jgi:hypothetical protein
VKIGRYIALGPVTGKPIVTEPLPQAVSMTLLPLRRPAYLKELIVCGGRSWASPSCVVMRNSSVPTVTLHTGCRRGIISDHTLTGVPKSQAARLVKPEPTVFTQSTRDQWQPASWTGARCRLISGFLGTGLHAVATTPRLSQCPVLSRHEPRPGARFPSRHLNSVARQLQTAARPK